MNELLDDYRNRLSQWLAELNFTRQHKRALLILIIPIIAVSSFVVLRSNTQPTPISEPIGIPAQVLIPEVMVDVAGGVKTPGVYSLSADSRVSDAITAAGGASAGTDLSNLNLARIIKDGEQIYVEPAGTTSKSIVGKVASKKIGPININRATKSEFDSLPGIGPVLAQRIFTYRRLHGPFTTLEDLQKVSGIGSSKFAALKSKIQI